MQLGRSAHLVVRIGTSEPKGVENGKVVCKDGVCVVVRYFSPARGTGQVLVSYRAREVRGVVGW